MASPFLWVAVVIGLLTSGAVWSIARQIGTGAVSSVYAYFATGMFFATLGLMALALPELAPAAIMTRVHDLLFVLGFGIMAYGARRLLVAVGLSRN